METLSKRVKPVRDLILKVYRGEGSPLKIKLHLHFMMYLRTNRGYGVYAGGHPQTVSMTQLLSFPPVEADPGRVPAVRRHRDLQLHPGRHHDRPEVWMYQMDAVSTCLYHCIHCIGRSPT